MSNHLPLMMVLWLAAMAARVGDVRNRVAAAAGNRRKSKKCGETNRLNRSRVSHYWSIQVKPRSKPQPSRWAPLPQVRIANGMKPIWKESLDSAYTNVNCLRATHGLNARAIVRHGLVRSSLVTGSQADGDPHPPLGPERLTTRRKNVENVRGTRFVLLLATWLVLSLPHLHGCRTGPLWVHRACRPKLAQQARYRDWLRHVVPECSQHCRPQADEGDDPSCLQRATWRPRSSSPRLPASLLCCWSALPR